MKEQLSINAKKYNFLDTIDINKYVDAIDQKAWKVAKIVGFKNAGHKNVITLHFDGHTDKWDEDFDLPATTKLAPFRRYTLPYTGPGEGYTIHRPPPFVNKFPEVVEQLKKLVNVQKEKLHGDKIVQKYRGQAFILIDNILTQQLTYRPEDLQQIQKLLDIYIEVGIHVIKYSVQKIGQINKQNIQDPNVIYVNPIHAIVSSLPEVLFNFNSLVSKKEKRVKFFMYNDRQNVQLRNKYRNIFKSLDLVGLCKRILQYQSPPNRGFSWSIKKEALILLNSLNQPIQFPKIMDSRQINEAIDFLGYIKSKQIFTQQEIQVINVDLVVSLILSGNFEGKLKGLTQLKRLVESRFGLKKQTIKERVLNPTLLLALTDSATFNGQIFKRSLPIFETAAKYELLSDEIIKRILNLHKDKHQLQVKSYFSSLAEFGEFLNEKKVVAFFQAIKQFPLTIDTINLIRDFTLKVIKQHPIFKKKYMQPNGPSFGVGYLWQVIKQSNSPEIVNNSILAFSSMISDLYYKSMLEKYFSQFFSNIKAGKNVQNSLKIIYNSLSKSREIATTIENLDKQFGIIDTVIKSLMEGNSISSSTIKSIFEFLEEVNHTVKKKITVQHIKDLWNLKQCQGPLLQFMRKSLKCEKTHQKIINKRLGEKDIKQIISKIFLNKALMDNYSKCDQELYKTFDELLISVNHKAKAIQYNYKHSIKCIAVNELFGLELYLEIALNSKNEDLQKKAIKRFIQFYLRPNTGYSKKVGLWATCVDRLSKYLDQSQVKYVAFLTMLEQIQGRMRSINILDESQSKFTVLIKGSNSKKTYSLPYCLSLWKVRQIIDEDFDLKKSNFEIYFASKKTAFEMDRQQDFSVMFIEPPKDASDPCVIVTQSREKHPQFVAIDEFKALFAQNYGEKIYESLSTIKRVDIQQIALKVLKQLPNIKSIQSKISKLDVSNASSWDQIFDPQCRVRLSYQIKIFNKLKSDQGANWTKQFLKKGGAEHLQKILKQRCPNKNPTVKDYEYFSQVLGIYYQVIQFYKVIQPNFVLSDSSLLQILRLSSKERANYKSLYNQPTFLEYFYSVISLIRSLSTNYTMNLKKILQSKQFSQVLQILLFTQLKTDQQNKLPQNIKTIYEKNQMQNELSNQCEIFLNNISSSEISKTSKPFFQLLVYIFDQNFVTEGLFQVVTNFIKKIRSQNISIFEEKQNSSNQLIVGWLKITKCLYLKSITTNLKLKVLPEPEDKFASFLINDGLFGQQHRFQSERTRFEALEILSHLNFKPQIMQKISGQINPIIKRSTWRKQNEWFVRNFKKREKNAKVGLRNLAATCYINSLLQQLFYIKQFSLPFLSIEANKIQVKQNVAYQIQKIFAYLTYSNRQVFSTETLCENFIVDGQPVDPRVQMDIDEFFHTLMDKLQFNLKKIKKQNLIDDIFQGEYSNLIVGQQCQHKSQRIQNFLSMRLEIINKSSLTQALTEFIKAEVLQGQNAYFCEKCDKKIKALKRVCVKSLPEVLILTLKRFEFDFEKMEKFKLNSYCSFEEYLDMEPYMRQSLYDNQDKLPTEQYKYRLKGVVVHYGISEAGHYTSYIRAQDNRWSYFDDDKITSFTFENLGKECFGGPDDNPYSEGGEKLKNAYLLIYEKVQTQRKPILQINPEIKAEVDGENLNNRQIKMVFDNGLQNFYDNNYIALGKNYILYVHLVALRSDQRSRLFKKSYENCRQILQQVPGIAKWYLEQFNENIIKQFLIYGLFQASQFVSSLITFALTKAFSQEFILKCLKLIDRKNMTYLNKIFCHASQVPEYFAVLNSMSLADRIMMVIKQDKVPNLKAVSKIQGNNQSDFGEPNLNFYQKKDFRSILQLFQSIQNYTIKTLSIQDIQFFIRKTKKHSILVSLAEICLRRFRDQQSFISIIQKFAFKYSINGQPKFQEQHIYKFALMLINKFCFLKDDLTKKRISYAAEAYFMIIKDSFTGYRCMKYTLEALFSLAFNNENFRQQILNQFNLKDNKKYIKNVKDWMKESDKVLNNLKFDKLGYWRKPSKNPYSILDRCENDVKVPPERYLGLFNALIEKHKIDFPDLILGKISKGEKVYMNQHFQYQYEVIDKLDILLIIRNSDNQQRIIFEDDVFLNRSV